MMDWKVRLAMAREDAWEEGYKTGLIEGRAEGLRESYIISTLRYVRLLMEDGKTFEEACAFLYLSETASDEVRKKYEETEETEESTEE